MRSVVLTNGCSMRGSSMSSGRRAMSTSQVWKSMSVMRTLRSSALRTPHERYQRTIRLLRTRLWAPFQGFSTPSTTIACISRAFSSGASPSRAPSTFRLPTFGIRSPMARLTTSLASRRALKTELWGSAFNRAQVARQFK